MIGQISEEFSDVLQKGFHADCLGVLRALLHSGDDMCLAQVSSYDNSQYGNYNQQSALKDFQPAPKYNAGNAHGAAGHAAYGAQLHATGQFGANAAAASTSAPLAAAAAGQQQVNNQSFELADAHMPLWC